MKYLVLYILLLLSVMSNAQLTVTNSLTPTQLVNNVLLGPGVVAFNIQYTGASQAIGFFNGVNTNIGLDSGIIISSGRVSDAIGPNSTTSITTINHTAGYPQLTQLAGQPTKDAAILEFDFIPSSDSVRFNYVFASDEYYEGVCTPYNDIFAFLINGPGISGVANIALVPGTTQPVSISSINGGVLGDPIYMPNASYTYCFLSNTAYYIDNTFPQGLTVEYDGFTKVLTAKAKVTPCQTYHIKLAIADGGSDDTWDSSVFLEAGSFNSHYLTVSNNPIYTGGIFNSASVEGCGKTTIIFKRYDSIPFPRTVNYTLSGTANPSDYQISAPNIYFAPGKDTVHLLIQPLYDNVTEGIETLSITLIPDFIVCNGWTIPGGTVNFTDDPNFNASIVKNTPSCPYDSVQLLANIYANAVINNDYTVSWQSNGITNYQNPLSVYVIDNTVYDVTVADKCGQHKEFSLTLNYDCPITIPNVITPNGDNVNDAFKVSDVAHFGTFNLYIYNRWGNLIYEMKNYDNSWSPTNTEDGTYFYVIETETHKKFKGYVSVFKK